MDEDICIYEQVKHARRWEKQQWRLWGKEQCSNHNITEQRHISEV